MNTHVAEVGNDSYAHYFGGNRWRVFSPAGSVPPAQLLLTLDLSDPMVDISSDIDSIPLCSRVDGDSFEEQRYVFDSASREVRFLGSPWQISVDFQDLLLSPLKESSLKLRPTSPTEDVSVSSVYDVQDTFLGGEAFIRIRGKPLWLADEEMPECECGKPMEFLACLGYEPYDRTSGIMTGFEPFFLGELALYFFTCLSCSQVKVVSQSS